MICFSIEKGLGAMLRETFVIGAESELVMMRWAWRLLSVYPGLCISISDKKNVQYKCKSKIIWKIFIVLQMFKVKFKQKSINLLRQKMM